ncbi:recombinase family protein [Altererythrobacter ishigakiensis]|uniref:DNA invertase Pin-like site-specific DNA recombinase n=1 Tax=Altererythrobacter ishigakiensis TaxID=476157 RepID=A0A562ULY5_9SPHN|nr:recombinase family protein [Altererythrobacter ishigakiensis]TWJ06625.1 DNA invertase Pin-like site-specific DNA recombinase [Altererythrobacter ishigakiensis]
MKKIRCAIYTRKSSEEGLEQDFNSLDAQREACAAYILSQASEGWSLLPELYDDGGISGGTLERPALQRLLADVDAGRIDIIVVYKVDRLTRSLLDFAKLVETFDDAEVSFVSVTQSFNTTNSMGRLTLNMLLSFAQFEREVTAERIRDKLAASKAKGMWMGGIPPLGYEPDGRSLKIVDEHAALIRDIYARYLQVGNVRILAEELLREGIRVPERTLTTGKSIGGGAFTRGQIYKILSNPIYRGKIAHKDEVFEGQHEALIDEDTFEYAQMKLAEKRHRRSTRNERSSALLAGLLFDEDGQVLQPVHTTKPVPGKPESASRRYRYYIQPSEPRGEGSNRPPALRIPACEIEPLVRKELKALFDKPLTLIERAKFDVPASLLPTIEVQCGRMASDLVRNGRNIVRQVLHKVTVYPDRLVLTLARSGIARLLELPSGCSGSEHLEHAVTARLKRSGLAVRLIQADGTSAGATTPDMALVKLIHQARSWWDKLAQGDIRIAELARAEDVTASYMTRVVRLAFLTPDMVDTILVGNTPADLTAERLLKASAITSDWVKQREELLLV